MNARDDTGETALHGAAAAGHATAVRTLLELGAKHDIPGSNNMHPLHWAAGWGSLATVRALVRFGADKNKPDVNGETAEQLARKRGRFRIANFLANEMRQPSPRLRANEEQLFAASLTIEL